ncbi:MAG: ComEC/Rec2 family competence protein [bacterium]
MCALVLVIVDMSDMSIKFNQNYDKVLFMGERIKNYVSDLTGCYFSIDQSSFLQSLIWGTSILSNNKDSLSMIVDFRRTGIAHLLSVSGFNVNIIIQVTTLLFVLFPSKYRLVFVNIIVLLYLVIFIGTDNIPASRAVIFGIVFTLSKYLGYKVSMKRLLLYYVISCLFFDIEWVKNISFLLTVSSICGILLFQRVILRCLSNLLPEPFDEALSVTLSALILVTPVSSFFFGNISVVAPISNVIVTPFAPILTVLYMLFLLISNPFREMIGNVIAIILNGLFIIISKLSNSQIAEIYFPKSFMLILIILISLIYVTNYIVKNRYWERFRIFFKRSIV